MNARVQIIESNEPAIREPIAIAPGYGNVDPSSLSFTDDIAFIDTETTGVDPDADAIVEIAIIRFRNGAPEVFHSLVNPGFPIPPTATAIHHIVDEDVADAPSLAELRPRIEAMLLGAMRAAHNVRFDALFVDPAVGETPDASKWLCSYRLARHVMPEAPAFGNNVLRYWLKTTPQSEGLGVHRAIDDTYVTVENARHMLRLCQARGMTTLAEVRDHANLPIISDTISFGKHVGKSFAEIPTDYFEWSLSEMKDLDPDLKISMEREVSRRPDRNQAAFDAEGKAIPVQPSEFMTFGKKYNTTPPTPMRDVPTDYFQFLIDKGVRLDPSVKLGMELVMEERKSAAKATLEAKAPAALMKLDSAMADVNRKLLAVLSLLKPHAPKVDVNAMLADAAEPELEAESPQTGTRFRSR